MTTIHFTGAPTVELMENIIKTSRALPPLPQIIAKANAVLANENAGFKEIGEVLETDQAMATRVLRLANSAYYGLSVPVSTVRQASAVLGFKTLYELITVVNSSQMMGKRIDGYGLGAGDIWKHSLCVAIGARIIAEKRYPELVNDAFMAGLIHDSGLLLLDARVMAESARFLTFMENGVSIQAAETAIFGFDHGAIAAAYLKKWNLPPAQIQAIRFHHYPSRSGGDVLSYLLHAADILVPLAGKENFILEDDVLAFIGLDPEELERLTIEVEASSAQIMETMGG